ncbi:glycoside hydrolase family 3 N-terminal domain-containing protein [Phycicoccus sp. Root101]|uniref:glycoside hydrolase family 3 N-terminal domain-containing protein n=1 Tax=Phycicoccus sp. Root101 TaxID=1736421 RepID=UPI0009E9D796|nr:glycoside hydrolase family 3 N-terminal domain-containing protein [Phycicoccus sp. Root101]
MTEDEGDGMRVRRTATVLVAGVVSGVVALAGSGPATAATVPTRSAPAQEVFARMTTAQRVGQLFMVGTPATGVSSAVSSAIANQHVGSVILTGRSTAGVTATRSVTNALQSRATAAATAGVPLAVATDQEGGLVQVLKGTGFSAMPSALDQGRSTATALKASATTWGRQLASAGVNVNLGPVADTVPSAAFAPHNAPIGAFDREYGYTPATVGSHAAAFAAGMRAAGVMPTAKHFPGLGRVTANTDTTANVKDTTTTRTDPYVAPFRTTAAGGAEFLMTSSAIYTRIDASRPAVFSPTVVTGMVRHDLGFEGVVISDDLGHAQAVGAWTLGQRAVDFILAGGDMVLTIDAAQAPAMVSAVLARTSSDASFRALVDTAALRVLTVKQRMGLLRPTGAVRATDVDEDAGSDVVGRATDGSLRLLRGDDRGGWKAVTAPAAPSFAAADLVLSAGDLDGDGHTDLLARRSSDGALLFHRGTGRGGFGSGTVIGTGWSSLTAIVAPGDVSGDGRPDLLARDVSGALRLYRFGTGARFLPGTTVIGTGWGGLDRILAVGDFDRDGHADLVARLASDGGLRLYRGTGASGFHSAVTIGSGWGGFDTVVGPGDLDGDGLSDMLARRPSGALSLYRGTRSGLRPGTPAGTAAGLALFG